MARRRDRGVSLVAHLLVAILIPLVLAGYYSIREFRAASRDRETASHLREEMKALGAIGSVYLPTAVERVAMLGLATIDARNNDRSVAAKVTGNDFTTVSKSSRTTLDDRLDALERVVGTVVLGSGRTVSNVLADVRQQLTSERRLSDETKARPADISAVFGNLQALIDELADRFIASAQATAGTSVATQSVIQDTVNGTMMQRTANAEAIAAFDLAIGGTSSTWRDADELANAHRVAIGVYRKEAAGPDLRPVTELLASPEYTAWDDATVTLLPQLPNAIGNGSYTTASIELSATFVLAHLHYFDQLDLTAASIQQNEAAEAQDVATLAADRSRRSMWTMIAAALGTLMILIFLRRQVVRPLRKLAAAADAISIGNLPTEPLRPTGPKEARLATNAFNDLVGTFGSVSRSVQSLAEGPGERADLISNVPGPLGDALRQSMGNLSDLTRRLHHSEALASAIVETAADAIWTVDEHGVIRSANGAAAKMVGVASSEQVGWPVTHVLDTSQSEAVVVTASGAQVPVLVSSSSAVTDGRTVATVFARDITERRRLELQLAYQARHDAMTALPNRSAALEYLDDLLVAGNRSTSAAAVMFIDLDGFKAVNDTHGHAVGDRVLRVVASRLRQVTSQPDLIARLGGDEFIVITPEPVSPEAVSRAGDRLIGELERPIDVGETVFSLSASIGVALASPGETDPQEVIRRADEAGHLAKERGRARVEVYNAEMQSLIEQQSATELALRHAVRTGELELMLQPIVDLASDACSTFEALVRWRRGGELVPAGEFIPIAERSSVIIEIGRWTLMEGCQVLARWSNEPDKRHRRVSINVSGRHLMDDRFVQDVDEAIELTGAPPDMIQLELTETHLLTDLGRARRTLGRVSARGISIAVDDFGAGYASMTYLRELQADVVKLDRQFIRRIATDAADQAIVQAMISISRVLGFDLVAEGVETKEQFDYLARHGCDRAQGYYIAYPMPIDDCEAWLANRVSAAATSV